MAFTRRPAPRHRHRTSGRIAALLVALMAVSGCGTSTGSVPGSPEAGSAATGTPAVSSVAATPTPESPSPTPSTTPESPSPASDGSPESPSPTPSTTPEPASPVPDRTPASPSPLPAGGTPGAAPLPRVGLAGVNDPACRSAHPPVVLLHGTFSTLAMNFGRLAPALLRAGLCVYGVNYGHRGVDPVADSAKAVTRFIGTVRSVTGARKVDVVGYSQGGLVVRTALRLDGLAPFVRVAVLIAPSFHGTTSPVVAAVPATLCAACADQAAGSALLDRLDAGGDLDGAVRYAVVSTERDAVVTPVSSQVPRGPADRVRSVTVQQQCPRSRVDHVALPADPGVVRWVVAALADVGRPPDSALTCG